MARKAKKEKYISERKTGFEIIVNRKGCRYSKFISLSDFGEDKRACLEYARKIRDERISQINAGYSISSKETLKNLFEESHEMLGITYKTQQRHLNIYRQSIQQIEDMRISEIKASDIQRMINSYAKTHSRDQVKRLKGLWNDLYRVAYLKGIRIFNEAELVTIPKRCAEPVTKKIETISEADYQIFMDYLHEYGSTEEELYRSRTVYFAIEVMRFTGVRPGEVYALTQKDISFRTGMISINKSLHAKADGSAETGSTKTKSSVREIPISEELRPVLKMILERRKNDFLFTDYYGNLLPIERTCDLVFHVSKASGIKFTQYSLRHRFAKQSIESGVPIHHIRDILGHTSASMSIYYAGTTAEDKLKAMETVNGKERILS